MAARQDRPSGMNDKPDREDDLPPAIPAATLVLFRERAEGAPELLVVERSAAMKFAGGAIVFPGGRTDADDHVIAINPEWVRSAAPLDSEEAASRVAAIRETLEESGIAFGFVDMPDAAWLTRARAALHARQSFGALLAEAGLVLDLDALIPFARWCPKHREARIFDTRFYIGKVPANTPEPLVDATENVSSFWASAESLITAADEGKVSVIYPTRRNLERLALFADFEAAQAQARAIQVVTISPFLEERDGERHLCIPADRGYPITSESLARATTAYPKSSMR
jgi:8-oxo-dGTP pyrophosphatase MutT (NUDIX family)